LHMAKPKRSRPNEKDQKGRRMFSPTKSAMSPVANPGQSSDKGRPPIMKK
jgi:hypothetical protein